MYFEDLLYEKRILSQGQLKEIKVKAKEQHYLPTIKVLFSEAVFKEALAFYQLEELRNVAGLKLETERMSSIADFFDLSEKGCYAFSLGEKQLWLLTDPDDSRLIEKIRQAQPHSIFAMATKEEQAFIAKRHIQPALIKMRANRIAADHSAEGNNARSFSSDTQHLYESLLHAALENRASDMHIIPMRSTVKIAFRIDGKIETYTYIPKDSLNNLKNIIENEAKLSVQNPNLPLDGKIMYDYLGKAIDIRINIIPGNLGWDINLRFLSDEVKGIEEIGFLEGDRKTFERLLRLSKGLIILTGPTGCGKTTSLYAGLSSVKDDGRKIMTLEDPVEITLEGITQINIRKDLKFDFDQGVASTLRHDPDIALIGESKTLSVAREIIRLADTGHLAITTLHTRDSVGAISRLINLGISPYAIADVLAAVMAQRLVRKLCPHCKETYFLERDHPWRPLFQLGEGAVELARGKGCSFCDGRGYHGRVAITEFLLSSPTIAAAIGRCENHFAITELAKKEGFRPMLQDGIEKALLHITTLDELEALAEDIL